VNVNPSLSLDLVSDVRQLVTFPFMVHALEAGTIVAVLAAAVGWYMVLRRQSFAGHTLSLMAFPGATGAALAGLPVSLGYYLACGAAALAMGRTSRSSTRGFGSETAVIGTVQTVGLAAGYLFLSLNSAVLTGTETLLFGTFLGVTQGQVVALLVIAVVVLGGLGIAARPLLFSTVDRDLAHASGIPVDALDVAFLLLLAMAVAATSQITGVLLVFAVLVAPAAAAQQITTRPAMSLLLGIAFALVVVWLGLGAAYFSKYPVGFYTTTFAFGLYVLVRLGRWALAGRG
jgi:zinc/manganese transport system permease protein